MEQLELHDGQLTGLSILAAVLGTGVSQFGYYVRKIITVHFPALIPTLAALVARGDISGSISGHLSPPRLVCHSLVTTSERLKPYTSQP